MKLKIRKVFNYAGQKLTNKNEEFSYGEKISTELLRSFENLVFSLIIIAFVSLLIYDMLLIRFNVINAKIHVKIKIIKTQTKITLFEIFS